jgi:hypothetical protein
MPFRMVILISLLCLLPAHAFGTETWMAVTLDGRKIGKMTVERDVNYDRISTSQVIDFHVARWTTALPVRNELRTVESSRGEPLEFHAHTMSSGEETLVEGHPRADGVFQISTTVGGVSKVSLLNWPDGAVLSEGRRLAFASHGFKKGTRYSLRAFDPVTQRVANADVEVLGNEFVDMPLGRETLHHLRQTLAGSDGSQPLDIWVDDQADVRRSVTPMFGARMEILACDEACANAPDQDIDVLRAAMVGSPRLITSSFALGTMRYTIAAGHGQKNPFIDTDEQHVLSVGDDVYEVTVASTAAADGGEAQPGSDDRAPNPWVQSTAPEIVAMASKVVGNASNDLQRMRRLRSFLTDYLDQSSLDVGYATALDTLHTRRGDCTEHAVLLTALARSQGISTRIVTGLVYTDRFAGASRVFVPHTWVQAWIGDRWISFDSADRRFDSTHIALAIGDGDPWRFFSAMNALGSISIKRAIPPAAQMSMPGGPGDRNLPPEPDHGREPVSSGSGSGNSGGGRSH